MSEGAALASLRAITPADDAFVFGVFAATRADPFRQAGLPETMIEQLLDQQFRAQRSHYHARFPGARFDIVLCAGQPIGYLYTQRGPDRFVLIDVALLPARRAQGIGALLVTELISEASTAGMPVEAHVGKGARAWNLWHRLGFEVVGDDGVYLALQRPPPHAD